MRTYSNQALRRPTWDERPQGRATISVWTGHTMPSRPW